jgi:hypothetical protein
VPFAYKLKNSQSYDAKTKGDFMKKFVIAAFLALSALVSANISAQNRSQNALETVASVDLKRYAGKWFEIARCSTSTKSFGVNRRHTAGSGGGNRLTVIMNPARRRRRKRRERWFSSCDLRFSDSRFRPFPATPLKSSVFGLCPMATKTPSVGKNTFFVFLIVENFHARHAFFFRAENFPISVFHITSIFSLAKTRSCIIFEARNESRRCIKLTFEAKRVKNSASSIAVSPPPTMTTGFAAKEKSVAGGARRNAVAAQAFGRGFFAGNAEPFGGRAVEIIKVSALITVEISVAVLARFAVKRERSLG